MRSILFLFILFCSVPMHAQGSEEVNVKKTIDEFFEGFHRKDSVAVRKTVTGTIELHTIGKNKEGNESISSVPFGNFLQAIVKIPDSVQFRELLLSYNIQVDGSMAHAWTPYEFWLNDSFSHCGVNSFQLFKEGETWKILSIMDTRRKENCYPMPPRKQD